MHMKFNNLILLFMILIISTSTQNAQAQNRFFWLVNIHSDLRIFLHGLVSLNQQEEEQTAILHHIHSSLTGWCSESEDSNTPRSPQPLCMHHITHHNWRNTPVRRVTFRSGIYSVENIERKVGGLESLISVMSFVGMFVMPLTQSQYFHGVEIPNTQTSAETIIPSLCAVGGTVVPSYPCSSLLGNFLNRASRSAAFGEQCLNVQHENSLSQIIHLLADVSIENTQPIYIPRLQVQGFYHHSQDSLWLLVPHPIMMILGLIPQSSHNNFLHRSPNRWFGYWLW